MENNEFVKAYMNMAERREPQSNYKRIMLNGERKKQEAAYREARVEVLRKLYEDNPVEEEKVCTYEDPIDKRKNCYEMEAIDENPYSPFNDLEALENKMPLKSDFF